MKFSDNFCVASCFKEFLSQKLCVYKLFSSLQTKGKHILSVGTNQVLEKLKLRRKYVWCAAIFAQKIGHLHICAASHVVAPQFLLLRRKFCYCTAIFTQKIWIPKHLRRKLFGCAASSVVAPQFMWLRRNTFKYVKINE